MSVEGWKLGALPRSTTHAREHQDACKYHELMGHAHGFRVNSASQFLSQPWTVGIFAGHELVIEFQSILLLWQKITFILWGFCGGITRNIDFRCQLTGGRSSLSSCEKSKPFISWFASQAPALNFKRVDSETVDICCEYICIPWRTNSSFNDHNSNVMDREWFSGSSNSTHEQKCWWRWDAADQSHNS